MGTYDEIRVSEDETLQVKSGPCMMETYAVGDSVPFHDGIHLTLEGAFAVHGGRVVYATTLVWDKWGDEVDTYDLLAERNPIAQALSKMREVSDESLG